MDRDDLNPRFHGTYDVTDDLRYVHDARFLTGVGDNGRLILIDTDPDNA